MTNPSQLITITPNPALDQTLEVEGFRQGAVNRVSTSRTDAGGKGINVATLLGDLGLAPAVTGFLGDKNAELFEAHFAAHHLADDFVRVPGSTRTGIKVVDSASRETTDINFPGFSVSPEALAEFEARLSARDLSGQWAAFSGSLPQGLPADFYRHAIELARSRGARTLLDTSREPLRHALAARPEILKPNQAELEDLLGTRLTSIEEVNAAARELLVDTTLLVVISMGEGGALFVNRKTSLLARPPRVEVASTVGAGDAMVAGILWSMLEHHSLTLLARWATAFAAHAVTRCGAGTSLPEVQSLVDQVRLSELPVSSPSILDFATGVRS